MDVDGGGSAAGTEELREKLILENEEMDEVDFGN